MRILNLFKNCLRAKLRWCGLGVKDLFVFLKELKAEFFLIGLIVTLVLFFASIAALSAIFAMLLA